MTSQHERERRMAALYDTGATTVYASRIDPRFSYTLYVPHRLSESDTERTTLLISVHGTGRMQSLYRDMFAEFAEYNNCIVLSPLFPAGVVDQKNLSGYKYLREQDIRYDLVMLGMIDEVSKRYQVNADKVLMFGFSGGGHFTHRFTLLYPQIIRAASIGAPGVVTLLDLSRKWPAGVSDCVEQFNIEIDTAAFRGLPMHFVVGGADHETWEIDIAEDDPCFIKGVNDIDVTRMQRIEALVTSFASYGALTRLDVVPGAAHDVTHVVQKTREFFSDVLNDCFTVSGPGNRAAHPPPD